MHACSQCVLSSVRCVIADFSSSDTIGESADEARLSSKKLKLMKMKGVAVYRMKFNKEWMLKYPFICKVQGDVCSFLFTVCAR